MLTQVVFVSSDQDEASFDEYFAEMPGLAAFPFSDREQKASLSRRARRRRSKVPVDAALRIGRLERWRADPVPFEERW